MLTRIRKAQAEREGGFTLIELLVVVIIIGILAAIAIPTFLNQREKAWTRAAQSDLRNAATVLESYFSESGTYDPAVGPTQTPAVPAPAYKNSDNVSITQPVGSATAYCLQAVHSKLEAGKNTFKLSSVDGKVMLGTCVAAPAA
ncbi:MAG TPA: prepilin-type N-terminal cleavage/methylation domain-containing protein [Mycobacteriales bacterium]|jgi:type IV pilus assembly protein PilA